MSVNPPFDFTDLQLLVNISEAGNLTRGAERSFISAPAASARVKDLETRLGTSLLARSNHGVELTLAGQSLVRRARSLLAQADQLSEDMRRFDGTTKQRIRLFGNTTAMAEVLPAVLEQFLPEHPDVEIEVRERLSRQIVQAVADGAADIGVVGGRPSNEALYFLPCRDDNLVLVVPQDHPLSNRDAIEFSDALGYDIVGLSVASAIHGYLLQTAEAIGAKSFRFRAEVGNFDVVCRMVEAGVGVGVVTRSVASRCSNTMSIALVPLADSWATRKLHVCVRNPNELSRSAKDLIELFVEQAS